MGVEVLYLCVADIKVESEVLADETVLMGEGLAVEFSVEILIHVAAQKKVYQFIVLFRAKADDFLNIVLRTLLTEFPSGGYVR